MSSPRSSTSSARSHTSSQFPAKTSPTPTNHRVASVCVPKGKWYDCLRPTTTPYQGFGGMASFNLNNYDDRAAGTDDAWTEEIHARMKQ